MPTLWSEGEGRRRWARTTGKVYRADILDHAYALVRANRGAPGIDGVTCASIEAGEGRSAWLTELGEQLARRTYRAEPVRRVQIPKADGGERSLGIPTLRDRVVQMAVKLVLEPIFEADFEEHSHGFRPGRSAHDAIDDVAGALVTGHSRVSVYHRTSLFLFRFSRLRLSKCHSDLTPLVRRIVPTTRGASMSSAD